VNADGGTLEPTWLGWLERTADEARKLEPVAGVSLLEMRTYWRARCCAIRMPLAWPIAGKFAVAPSSSPSDRPVVEFVASHCRRNARRRPGAQKARPSEALGVCCRWNSSKPEANVYGCLWEGVDAGRCAARMDQAADLHRRCGLPHPRAFAPSGRIFCRETSCRALGPLFRSSNELAAAHLAA